MTVQPRIRIPNKPPLKAPCDRCDADTVGEGWVDAGALIVTLLSPMMANESPPIILCGECAPLAVEFMVPEFVQRRAE